MASTELATMLRWVVITGSAFLTQFLACGCSVAMGVFYVKFLEVFQRSHGLTAWIGSINYAVLCAMGPFASVLCTRYGCHVTITLGGVTAGLGLVISSYANSIYVIFVSHGVITGCGYGLCFTAAVIVINLQFSKNRTIAMGIAISGIGVGAAVYPFVFHYLNEQYGWRGALLITGGLTFHTCIAGALLGLAGVSEKPKLIEEVIPPNGFKERDLTIDEEKDEKSIDLLLEDEKDIPTLSKSQYMISVMPYLGNYHYWLLHINCLLFCFGQSVVFTHIMAYGESVSLLTNEAAALISVMGLANIAGRILLGIVSSISCINIMALFIICYFFCGVSIYLVTVASMVWYLMTIMVIFGFLSGAYGPVLSEVCCRMVGIQCFSSAYGILLISMGTGTLIGAPIAGELFDYTSIYANSLYLGAAAFCGSGLIMLPSWTLFKASIDKPDTMDEQL